MVRRTVELDGRKYTWIPKGKYWISKSFDKTIIITEIAMMIALEDK